MKSHEIPWNLIKSLFLEVQSTAIDHDMALAATSAWNGEFDGDLAARPNENGSQMVS